MHVICTHTHHWHSGRTQVSLSCETASRQHPKIQESSLLKTTAPFHSHGSINQWGIWWMTADLHTPLPSVKTLTQQAWSNLSSLKQQSTHMNIHQCHSHNTLTSTLQPTVQLGLLSTSRWQIKWIRLVLPTPGESKMIQFSFISNVSYLCFLGPGFSPSWGSLKPCPIIRRGVVEPGGCALATLNPAPFF